MTDGHSVSLSWRRDPSWAYVGSIRISSGVWDQRANRTVFV
jgi:hypothetical protein